MHFTSRNIAVAALSSAACLFSASCAPRHGISGDFAPPPQESSLTTHNNLNHTIDALRERIIIAPHVTDGSYEDGSTGLAYASPGINRDEATAILFAYLLRRAELSDVSLSRTLATGTPDYAVLRDAHMLAQLGPVINVHKVSDNTRLYGIPINTSALPTYSTDTAKIGFEINEAIVLARTYAAMLESSGSTSRTERHLGLELALKLANIWHTDLELARRQDTGTISHQEVLARLREDKGAADWLRVLVADSAVSQYSPLARALDTLSPTAAGLLRGDSDKPSAFATFDNWWGNQLSPDQRTVWEQSPIAERFPLWVLFRSIPVSAFKGWGSSDSIVVVAATEEHRKLVARIDPITAGQAADDIQVASENSP